MTLLLYHCAVRSVQCTVGETRRSCDQSYTLKEDLKVYFPILGLIRKILTFSRLIEIPKTLDTGSHMNFFRARILRCQISLSITFSVCPLKEEKWEIINMNTNFRYYSSSQNCDHQLAIIQQPYYFASCLDYIIVSK